MPEPLKPLTIHNYLEIGLRRRWVILLPFVISVFVSFGVYKILPKVYKATTLILVQPQTVPENYVRSTISEPMVSRLNTISQEILSRTVLEKVIHEFNLYADLRNRISMEETVEIMRKAVEVKVQDQRRERAQNSFTISHEGKEPEVVMKVTNRLAAIFIEANLKGRESQAEGTSAFLSKELLDMEARLKREEQSIRRFKEQHAGKLPEQLNANLRILERVQQQLQTTANSIRATEDRSMLIQNQIELFKRQGSVQIAREARRGSATNQEVSAGDRASEDLIITQLNSLKTDLTIARSKYKENHPDVMDLKKRIANLEPRVMKLLEGKEARVKVQGADITEEDLPFPIPIKENERLLAQYKEQYNDALSEAKRLRQEEKNLKEEIALYQKRIEATPKLEQELSLLTRDYEFLKTSYQSLLDKRTQAQMAENLERKQQRDQFKVVDPARLPEKPIRPDPKKVLLIGAMAGMLFGLGLAWFQESSDQSVRTVAELEEVMKLPVLAILPNLKEERRGAA